MGEGEDDGGGLGCCTVCLTPLLTSDDALASTPCGHLYHYRCIVQSLEYKKACPNCCQPVNEGTLHRLAGCYSKGAAAGDGAGEEEGGAATAELRKQLASMRSHAEFLAKEVKKSEKVEAALREEAVNAKRNLRAVVEQATGAKREQAKLWDELAQAKRANQLQTELLEAHKLRTKVASGVPSDAVAEEVLAADSGVKNIYIQDMHRLLKDEKARHKAAVAKAAAQADVIVTLKEKVARYKDKLREVRDGKGEAALGARKRSRSDLEDGDRAADAFLPAHVKRAANRLESAQLPAVLHPLPINLLPPSVKPAAGLTRVVRRKSSFADDAADTADTQKLEAEAQSLVPPPPPPPQPTTPSLTQAKLQFVPL